MDTMFSLLVAAHPAVGVILSGLGSLVILGQTYVAMTPTQSDDAWFARLESSAIVGPILRAVVAFAPIQRKEG